MRDLGNKKEYADWEKRLYSVKEAAQYLGLPSKRIYESLRPQATPEAKARFPVRAKRAGKFWLFEKKDLENYADSLPYSDE